MEEKQHQSNKPADEMANEEQQSVDETSIEALQEKCDEYLNGWKRAKADYLNFKKETEKKQSETVQYANAALLAQLFPIIDNFKLAMKHVPQDQKSADWIVGLEHIQKQFADFLEQLGITSIATVDQKFDPTLHEAVAHEEKDGVGQDIIFEEVQPGYLLHGKVLQVARVKVAK